MSGNRPLGPVQVLVIGLEQPAADEVLSERLRHLHDGVELLDFLLVHRHRNGAITELREVEPDGGARGGQLAAPLLGIGEGDATALIDGEEERWYLADHVPAGTTAAIVLLEHRWAIPLREAVAALDAEVLGDAWVHPQDLSAIPD